MGDSAPHFGHFITPFPSESLRSLMSSKAVILLRLKRNKGVLQLGLLQMISLSMQDCSKGFRLTVRL
jgi:hypothetical protein